MALPFLPAEEIPTEFTRLTKTNLSTALQELVKYVESTWITGSYSPENWSIYGQPIRTNNDLEGYHNALNRRAAGCQHLPFYMLIQILYNEALLCTLQMRLVRLKKLKRYQRKIYRHLQGKIGQVWQDYSDGKVTARQLLETCSYVNGPARTD